MTWADYFLLTFLLIVALGVGFVYGWIYGGFLVTENLNICEREVRFERQQKELYQELKKDLEDNFHNNYKGK